MVEFEFEPVFWHWLVLGLVLGIVELLAPGTFFLWLGVSAGLVGLLILVFPKIGWEYQVLWFSVLAVISVVLSRRYLKSRPIESDHPLLNRRGQQYVGRVFTLEEPIVNGQGKIRVDDSTWKIKGPDCDAGSKVEVAGVDGVILQVRIWSHDIAADDELPSMKHDG